MTGNGRVLMKFITAIPCSRAAGAAHRTHRRHFLPYSGAFRITYSVRPSPDVVLFAVDKLHHAHPATRHALHHPTVPRDIARAATLPVAHAGVTGCLRSPTSLMARCMDGHVRAGYSASVLARRNTGVCRFGGIRDYPGNGSRRYGTPPPDACVRDTYAATWDRCGAFFYACA